MLKIINRNKKIYSNIFKSLQPFKRHNQKLYIGKCLGVSYFRTESIKMSKVLDLRDYEQVCTRMEAEQYAGLLGYRKYYFGCDSEPSEVGHDIFQADFESNRLLSHEQVVKLQTDGIEALFT